MVKHVFVFILFSVIAVLILPVIGHILHGLVQVHDYIAGLLTNVFSDSTWGTYVLQMIVLIVIPLVICEIVALVYWFVKHKNFQYREAVWWIVWAVYVASLAMHHYYMSLAPPQ